MSDYKYTDILFEIKGKIGIITFNRPKKLNSFGGNLLTDTAHALRVLDSHPDTQITVITGSGRFFSAGADVKETAARPAKEYAHDTDKKLDIFSRLSNATVLVRNLITHRKVLVLALNGPAVGGGAAWFPGLADILIASKTTYLQCPFAALGLVPEFGSVCNFPESIGVHRANDFLMFGRKLTVEELEQWGLVNYVFEHEGFHGTVIEFLEKQLEVNDGDSMMEHKRLMNQQLIPGRLAALHEAVDALSERFVVDAPAQRFAEKGRLMNEASKKRAGGSKL